MGRLIDVDNITDEQIVDYLGIRYASCACDVRDLLNEQPTAYDPDKVVEQLESLPQCSTWNHNSDNVSRQSVIEVVKGGGADGN